VQIPHSPTAMNLRTLMRSKHLVAQARLALEASCLPRTHPSLFDIR
jgi:hypothetical protein